jgi:D-inositol-3-phosphate glycosyltransferase
MKILIIGPAHPFRGGIAALNDRLAQELTKDGHETTLVSFSLQYPNFLFPGKTQYATTPRPEGLRVLELINSINPLNWISTGFKLRKMKADLILVRFWLPFMGPSTGTVCRIAKSKHTKVIAITDNIIPHEKRPGDMLFTRYFTQACDGFLAMSECVYQELDQFRKNKPKQLSPHPIYDHYGKSISREDALTNLNLDPKYRYILFFGFIRDYKGLDLLLEAFAQIDYKKLKIRILVAGEFYSNEKKYTDLIEHLNLKHEVILRTDYIPDNEVNSFFCASDLIAQPYKTATQSGVTQIGYHFDKPMLVTNVGGLAEIVDHNKGGYVVPPTSSDVALALEDFFNMNRKHKMEAHVEISKERFSWSYFCRSIMKIYEQIS